MSTTELWPDVVTVDVDDVVGDPADAHRLLTEVEAAAQRLVVRQPVRLGIDPAFDAGWLRFLNAATRRWHLPLHWSLAGKLPWPLRTVVHMQPPNSTEPGAAALVSRWRGDFAVALCTFRLGPDFVAIRDRRPGGTAFRAHLDGRWVAAFHTLLEGSVNTDDDRQLLDELTAAGLALRLDTERHVVLAQRLCRWPVPYSEA